MSPGLGWTKTYAKLGPTSIWRVAAYRLALKSGLHPVQRLSSPVAEPPFFRAVDATNQSNEPNLAWDRNMWWFGWYCMPTTDSPPDWFANPFSSSAQPNAATDWWLIADFGAGDIKGLWEISRMNWAVAWATAAARDDSEALARLNLWIADWASKNPPYKGPNWKCGQEAAIRVMHLITAAWVLGQDKTPEAGLIELLRAHLQRIEPTMSYAIGQQNNHGTSEAAALFMGGSCLAGHDPRADSWAQKGRLWLEKLAVSLIEPDGSFSQYSVTYHRLMLDTYALAEAWRRHRGLIAFSERLRARLATATDWLWSMVDLKTGDAPNIGANDGADLLQLTGAGYRDFRSSVQLAAALFRGSNAFGRGHWNIPLGWLGVSEGRPSGCPASRSFEHGGYHVLRSASSTAVLRYPRFRFRPSQADALHVDFWHNGINVLRDAGTYSYNSGESAWFSGTAAHNTIEFDSRDQMPRLGRFLFGDWLRAEIASPVSDDGSLVRAAAGYADNNGAQHYREITLCRDRLTCSDTVAGKFKTACLRWRLVPGDWRVENGTACNGTYSITIEIDGERVCPTLSTTKESLYYQQKTKIPQVSVSVMRPVQVVTTVSF